MVTEKKWKELHVKDRGDVSMGDKEELFGRAGEGERARAENWHSKLEKIPDIDRAIMDNATDLPNPGLKNSAN